ncbi:MAG: hypothetical protein JXA66_07910 [Oligoflexia bacterium]|nr:hypothetical protein [Oligoflexia bacterium]
MPFVTISLFHAGAYVGETTKKPAFEYEIQTSNLSTGSVSVDLTVTSFPEQNRIKFELNTDTMERFRVYDLNGKRIKHRMSGKFIEFETKETSFVIKYKARTSTYTRKMGGKSELPNLVIEDSMILFGQNTFVSPVFPESMNLSPSIFVRFSFPDFWKFISSWSMPTLTKQENVKYTVMDVKSLLDGIILAGDLEIEKTRIKGKYYYLLFMGDWVGKKKRILSLYKIIAQKQNELWNFLPADFLIVAFLKDKTINVGKGFQYTNTIVHVLPSEVGLRDLDFLKLLAHEHFHIWNGSYLKPREKEYESIKWFHEGATEYYSLMTLISSGLIDEQAFLDYLVASYLKYDSAILGGTTNNSEANEYFIEKDVFLIMAMDIEIRKASRLKKSFKDVLKNISVRSSFWEKGYVNSDLKAEIGKVAPNWDFEDFFDRYVYRKEKLDLKSCFEYLGLEFSTKVSYKFDQGFDISENSKRKWVANINRDSNAYKSGLRNGDTVTEIHKPSKPSKDMTVKVAKSRDVKDITFSPWIQNSRLVLELKRKTRIYSQWTEL